MKRDKLNELKVKLRAVSSNESLARVMTTAFLMPWSPTVEEIADIKTAVSEAVTNAIVHGCASDASQYIQIRLVMYSEGTFLVSVTDRGRGIPDIKAAMEPLFTTDAENERSGMGFSIMETFSDKLAVRSKVGEGTSVTMTRRLLHFKNEQ